MRISELEYAINTVPTVCRHTEPISFVRKDNCQFTLYNLVFRVKFPDFNKQTKEKPCVLSYLLVLFWDYDNTAFAL